MMSKERHPLSPAVLVSGIIATFIGGMLAAYLTQSLWPRSQVESREVQLPPQTPSETSTAGSGLIEGDSEEKPEQMPNVVPVPERRSSATHQAPRPSSKRKNPVSEEETSVQYVSNDEVIEKLDCRSVYTEGQREIFLEKHLKGKRIRVTGEVSFIRVAWSQIKLSKVAGYYDGPLLLARDKEIFEKIQKGMSYSFDCRVMKSCTDTSVWFTTFDPVVLDDCFLA